MRAVPSKYRESGPFNRHEAFSWIVVPPKAMIACAIAGAIEAVVTISIVEFWTKFFVYYEDEINWQLLPRGAIRQVAGMGEK